MISDADVRLSEWILNHNCLNRHSCVCCPHYDNCNKDLRKWKVDNPPPEPTERQRIEWLRMLPDNDAIMAINKGYQTCGHCNHLPNGTCFTPAEHEHCMIGYVGWWHDVVTLEQFREDVRLK